MRLQPQSGERVDRTRPIEFSFDGKPVQALVGDTIASALLASGRQTLSRSFKYHRPRGELCCNGSCANSMVDVDGWPGVKACQEPVRAGAQVRHLNAWPNLDFDIMNVVDRFGGPFTPPGFYYKTMIRPRRLWPVYEKLLRRVAGLGRLEGGQTDREWVTRYRRRHCDVMVIGGGAAGLAAARAAAAAGADVVLVDQDLEPGGRLLSEAHEDARDLTAATVEAGVEVLSGASALGSFDGLMPVWQGDTLHQIRARRYVAATGTTEQPLIFPNNDLPGVMLSGGARRLVSLYGVAPGNSALVTTTNDGGIDDAIAMHEAGVRISAVADLRVEAGEGSRREELSSLGIPLLRGETVVRARGRRAVTGAVTAKVDDAGRAVAGTNRHEVDAILVSGGQAPTSSLLLQAGARASYDPTRGVFSAAELPAGVGSAGAVAGYGRREEAIASGTVAGLEAADGCGIEVGGQLAEARDRLRDLSGGVEISAIPPALSTDGGRGKAFVDFDEDVTVKDVRYSVDEGYDSIELSKRYTTATMGPSQGRFSQLALIRTVGEATGRVSGEIGMTTARPPWVPVPLGVLAGRPFEPAKRSAVHRRHRELGGDVRWAGDWRRPYHYGDPEDEAMAVHDSAGLVDVSTLGKIIVQGPEAGRFLDRLYPNRLSNLKVGRIRYGILCSEAGRITDDGTICRIDEETYLVTTTSSGLESVLSWFTNWLEDWRLGVTVIDVSQGLSAMNLAGPRSREILESVSGIDCDSEAFPYLSARTGKVAGVEALAMRIGFVGELGYELHMPASYGEHVWDSLSAAAESLDISLRPFGLEPQRILRLQKMHVLVGQDTDSESTPYNSAMSWAVKLDKDEPFVGQWALETAADREPETALVGITVQGDQVPAEGSVVLAAAGETLGQVTSARYSPRLNCVIGLAWVPASSASEGETVEISDAGSRLRATVSTTPFYDPDGAVVRA